MALQNKYKSNPHWRHVNLHMNMFHWYAKRHTIPAALKFTRKYSQELHVGIQMSVLFRLDRALPNQVPKIETLDVRLAHKVNKTCIYM